MKDSIPTACHYKPLCRQFVVRRIVAVQASRPDNVWPVMTRGGDFDWNRRGQVAYALEDDEAASTTHFKRFRSVGGVFVDISEEYNVLKRMSFTIAHSHSLNRAHLSGKRLKPNMSELFSDVLAEEWAPPTQTQRQDALEAFTQKVSDEMNILVQTEGRDYNIINLLTELLVVPRRMRPIVVLRIKFLPFFLGMVRQMIREDVCHVLLAGVAVSCCRGLQAACSKIL